MKGDLPDQKSYEQEDPKHFTISLISRTWYFSFMVDAAGF